MGTLNATPETSTSIGLDWDFTQDVGTGSVQMVVIVQTAPNVATRSVTQQPVAMGTTSFGTLKASTTYTYQLTITYIDEFGDPVTSGSTASATTLAAPPPPPPKHATPPTNVQATAESFDTVKVTWGPGSNLTSYNVSRVAVATNTATAIASNLSLATTSHSDTISPSPSPGAQFSYIVQAFNPPPGTSASATSNVITIPLQVLKIVPSVTSIVGGLPFACVVDLSGNAPAAGAEVAIQSTSSQVAVPSMVPVQAGSSQSQPFSVNTDAVAQATPVTITATLNGAQVGANVTLEPLIPTAVSIAVASLIGGAGTTGFVTLNAPAPSGIQVALASSSTLVGVQQFVVVQGQQTQSETFAVTTKAVTSATSVTITATFNNVSAQFILILLPLQLANFVLNPTTVLGGSETTGTVTLNGAAPQAAAIGLTTLPSGLADLVGLAPSVPVRQSSANFKLSATPLAGGSAPRTVAITASFGGVSLTQTLTVKTEFPPPITIASVTVFPTTIPGGSTARGTVTLEAPAPSGGAEIGLTAASGALHPIQGSSPAAPILATVPASVTVLAGNTTVGFTVETKSLQNLSSPQSVTIGAISAGSERFAMLTLT